MAVKTRYDENDPGAWVYITDAPFSRWYRQGVFDSAKDCTAARQKLIDKARELVLKLEGTPQKLASRRFDTVSLAAARASECVASDDPRLLR